MLDGVLAVIFPSGCVLCGAELGSEGKHRICVECWASIEPWRGPACARCGLPFPSPHALDSTAAECGGCRAEAPPFDRARSFGLYTGKLRQLVLRLKFGGEDRLGLRLGALLAGPWESLSEESQRGPALLVPVPLHASRRRERGFNQSELLARGLVRALTGRKDGITPRVASDCLRRDRVTPPQTGLSVSARRENLRGAFSAENSAALQGQTVVLIDDVMTTGATLSACARTLRRAGAAHVLALTLARATPLFPDLGRDESDNGVDGLGPESR